MIFINENAVKLDDIILNEDWSIKKVYDRIFSLTVGTANSNWLVKTYDKEKYARREYDNLIKCKKFKGIPKVLAASISPNFNYIIISKIEGLDLLEHIRKFGIVSEVETFSIAKKILKILNKIHSVGIVHKDIKPENVIYNNITKEIHLIDFEGKETPNFRSPEQLKGEPLTPKTDIWSLGILLYNIHTGRIPFRGKRETLEKPLRFSKGISERFKSFIEILVERDIDIRYDTEDALDFLEKLKMSNNK